jgi:CheY-like chemotaxis protein
MKALTILLVEDELIIAMSTKKHLEAAGYRVIYPVMTGDDAVSRASEDRPDLILMDYLLKGQKTGLDAAREIRVSQQVPILFVTGNPGLLNQDELASLGSHTAVLTKPVHNSLLLESIQRFFP